MPLAGSRAQLRQRLPSRFEAMLAAGLVEEVRALYARGDLTPSASIDARGRLSAALALLCRRIARLQDATAQAVTATAQLAKRQMTWLRRERELTLLRDAL